MKTCSVEVIILDLDTKDHGSSPSLAIICDFLLLFFCLFLLLLFLVLNRPFLLSMHSYQPFYMFVVLLAYVSIIVCNSRNIAEQRVNFDRCACDALVVSVEFLFFFVLLIIIIHLWYFS